MTDPVLDKRQELLDWLQVALELELTTIPAYLVALLSIKRPANREAADIIRSVAIEEMLHLALVANVINAIGGTPRVDARTIPQFPVQMTFEGKTFADRKFPIDLAPFSAATIETFLQIELPQRPKAEFKLWKADLVVPDLTIGEFYNRIIDRLEELDGAGALFQGDPTFQLHPDYYWSGGGEIIPVQDLASAKAALAIVVRQGEGAWDAAGSPVNRQGDRFALGHYYRFNEIHYQRRYADGDDPAQPPTGDPIAVDYGAVYPIKVNAKASDYPEGSSAAELNLAFNRDYTLMLRQIADAFNGTPRALYTAIMNGMHAVSSRALQLISLPIDAAGGEHACPTFEWVE